MDTLANIEVEYNCPTCDMNFVVYHYEADVRNTHCWWCQKEVKETGKVRKIEGKEIVSYLHGKETYREPKKEPSNVR